MVVTATGSSLERLLRPAEPVPILAERGEATDAIVAADGSARNWLQNGHWQLFAAPADIGRGPGESFATFTTSRGDRLEATFDEKARVVTLPFALDEAYRGYVCEEWTNDSPYRRLSAEQLDLFYRTKRLVPRAAQIAGRRMIIRWQGRPDFPAWPLDLSVSRLLRFYAFCQLLVQDRTEGRFRWFWPDGNRAAMILTHDVENESGVRRALAVADLEEEHGFRSSFNFGAWYPLDPGLLRELTSRGFEVGVHGLRHDRSLFASRGAFDAGVPRLRRFADHLGAQGFRSPATHRIHDWLAELPFEYDCSIPHSDPFEPQPGGSCSFWPYFLGPVVELPYTLPQDYTLFTLLRQRSTRLWLDQCEQLVEQNGLIQCVTHSDDGYLGDANQWELYREFLSAMSERDEIWRALPREVAAWWRERDGSEPSDRVTEGIVSRGETYQDVSLRPVARSSRQPV